MTFRKLLFKTADGRPVASLTVSGCPPIVTLPQNVKAEACLAGSLFFPTERRFPLDPGEKDFSILGAMAGEPVFATTLTGQDVALAKWRLLSAVQKKQLPTQPLQEPLPEPDLPKEVPEPEPPILPAAEQTESVLSRAERRLEEGAPFPLFEKLMPGTRWAVVKEEEAEYLVGIREENGEKRVLYGIPGAQGCPPDEDKLWAFFPTENEDLGYFITEADLEG